MMTIVFILLFIWCIRIIVNIFSFAYLWYIKEYRFDRMFVHIKTEGIRIVFAPMVRRPPVRPKALVLILGSITLLFFLYTILPFFPLISILIVDIFTFTTTAIVVGLLKLPTAAYHSFIVFFAARKLGFHIPMKVIGVTGSVGKSSTKEYLATILSTKYNVLKTFGSKNALVGVAETINKELVPEHEVFVVEMAAYKKGEIADIARLVLPTVGIVTTINEQHLDLFGSIENTMNAKYELIEHLQNPAIAISNADNTYTHQMAQRAAHEGKEVWMFTAKREIIPFAKRIFRASNIDAGLTKLSFIISLNKQKRNIEVPLLGEHQVVPILAAVAGAVACGMSFDDAVAGARMLQPFRKTMQPISGINGSLFIDDTFNNNPQAAMAAIRFLTHAKGKKFLVFQPMIELGPYSEQAHREVGELAGKICDEIILTNHLFSQFFIEGAKAAGFTKLIHIFSPQEGSNFIQSNTAKNDAVLFKGKEAAQILQRVNMLTR